jgi:hypothetical protein
MPAGYNPSDWYWIIGGSATDVWSSARAMSVPIADATYTDWMNAGNTATAIASLTELYAVLAQQFPAGSLPTYNPDARSRKATGGVIITSISPIAFMSDPVSRNTLANADSFAKANPGHITDWKLSDGSFIKLNEAQLATALNDMATFVQSCFTKESDNLTAINGGTITTIAQIDAAFAAISNVFP